MSVITLTTDFGPGEYVAQMKGVILSLLPGTTFVDGSHEIRPGDVLEAAYLMEVMVPAFPPGSVNVVVVDPGVGTGRKALVVRYAERTLVAPDNGCLTAFFDEATAVHEITEESLFLPEVSATFHGRDIFAPVAAYLAGGGTLTGVGPEFSGEPVRVEGLHAEGEHGRVLHVDRFGNLVTSFPGQSVTDRARLEGPQGIVERTARTFSEVEPGLAFLYAGSGGRLEVGVSGGSAAKHLGWGPGTELRLRSDA
jgi:S-adenosylmethionine hydrolase